MNNGRRKCCHLRKNERTMARIKINSIATSVLKSYLKDRAKSDQS